MTAFTVGEHTLTSVQLLFLIKRQLTAIILSQIYRTGIHTLRIPKLVWGTAVYAQEQIMYNQTKSRMNNKNTHVCTHFRVTMQNDSVYTFLGYYAKWQCVHIFGIPCNMTVCTQFQVNYWKMTTNRVGTNYALNLGIYHDGIRPTNHGVPGYQFCPKLQAGLTHGSRHT